ncbi:MAG: hypothetical protein A4E25_00006 [Methanobacterium sp. PtaB.Bin024]|jgi:hypothetical protein|nr:MAG: hypothetical protein A4E25_00006 [Methanobacterium sp. PtaB.Bin024]
MTAHIYEHIQSTIHTSPKVYSSYYFSSIIPSFTWISLQNITKIKKEEIDSKILSGGFNIIKWSKNFDGTKKMVIN